MTIGANLLFNIPQKTVLLISLSLSITMPVYADATVAEQAKKEQQMIPYQTTATNSSWEDKLIDPHFYDNPYQISLFSPGQGENSERLLSQTYSIFGLGLGVIGVLAIMPTEVTNWETSNLDLGKKWSENVKAGPVWDRDDVILNYMMHPYFGGVYYQTARKSGYRQWDAFLYSAIMSTFFWEYGIEAFAETPSLQDLVVTPVLGWAYGEWAYTTERDIWENDGKLFGSKNLGQLATVLLDPVDSFGRNLNELIGRDLLKAGTGYFTYNQVPLANGHASEKQIGFNVSYVFGDDDGDALPGISGQRAQRSQSEHIEDPVHTGIIGISAGPVFIDLDSQWNTQSTWGYQWSLGLYFTPRFSSRLHYSRAIIDDNQTTNRIIYENYGVDSQYYFNSEADLRPFVIAGLSEMIIDEEDANNYFQFNAGVGLHYKINQNWAIQTDWKHYYSRSLKNRDNLLSSAIVYRFGVGEE